MNDGTEDRILDSFLEEMLTNQHPPDLTEQIQARLRAELGPERFEQLRSVTPGKRAVKGSTNASTNASTNNVPMPGSAWQSWTGVSAIALTLAAALMLALAAWKFWPAEDRSTQIAGDNTQRKVEKDNLLPGGPRAPELANFPTSNDAGSGNVNSPKGKELPLEHLPFSVDTPMPEIVSRPPAAAPVAQLSDEEIVRKLDALFAQLWQSRGIAISSNVDEASWTSRVAFSLSGNKNLASEQSPSQLAKKLVRTATFAELFADRVTDFWLKGTPEASADNPAGRSLRNYLAQQLVAGKPWNDVLSSLIDSQPDAPQAVMLASLAGGGNHRLAGRIGSVMLDEALACARCHDASDNGRVITMDQDDYWSLVAIFSGVDAKLLKASENNAAARQLVDNQKQLFEGTKLHPVYFERPDGRLQAARYRLPGGDDWRAVEDVQTPRQSLASWITRSSVTDQASVNLAWRLTFGRPLVAQHSALDGEGFAQRREILSLLAEQFQAHHRDMGQLVTWIVSSRAFAQDTLDIDRSRWLAASEDEIMHWNDAVTNFAARLPESSSLAPSKSLESALVRIDSWTNTRDDRRTTLAQPNDKAAVPKPAVKPASEEPLAGYLIHSVKPTYAQNVFINRLVKSKLSWQQQVDHIAGLVGEQSGNARLHSMAQKILEAKSGDRAAALFQLLQGALMCHEAM